MRKIFLIPLAILMSCGTAKNTNTTSQVGEQLLKDVETLASDSYEGRKTGTKGGEMARTYLTGRLKEIGLNPCEVKNEKIRQIAHRYGHAI